MDKGNAINQLNIYGFTPLAKAIEGGNSEGEKNFLPMEQIKISGLDLLILIIAQNIFYLKKDRPY